MEELKWITSMGIGGILAAGMFLYYRRDFLRERRNGQETKQLRIEREKVFINLVEGNIKSNTELTGSLHELREFLKLKLP